MRKALQWWAVTAAHIEYLEQANPSVWYVFNSSFLRFVCNCWTQISLANSHGLHSILQTPFGWEWQGHW